MEALKGARLKADRGHEHFHTMSEGLMARLGGEGQEVTGKVTQRLSHYVFSTAFTEEVVNDISLGVSDAAMDLGAALDYVAHALLEEEALKAEGALPSFPVLLVRHPSALLPFVAPARAVLEQFQPYTTHPKDPRGSPLWAVRQIILEGQTHLVPVVVRGNAEADGPLPEAFKAIPDEIGTLAVPAPDRGVLPKEARIRVEPRLEIMEPGGPRGHPLTVLHEAYRMITDKMIPALERVVPGKGRGSRV